MRILQVSYRRIPRSRARAGGDLGTFQNLQALSALGHEVHLAVCGGPFEVEPEVAALAAQVHWVPARRESLAQRAAGRCFQLDTLRLRFPDRDGYATGLLRLAERLAVDLVWADTTFGIAVAPRTRFPTIYGHYDFLYLLKAVRAESRPAPRLGDLASGPEGWRRFRSALRRPDSMSTEQLERLELRCCREASLVVSVSASACGLLREHGIAADHVPIVGPTLPARTGEPAAPARLLLFGNHNTANRAVLTEIRARLWPAVVTRASPVEWHQVGQVPAEEGDADWEWARRHFHSMHGFVPCLESVLRPGDISLVPYGFDTGFRTKFTVAAAHGVVSAGYPETFECAPEFTPGEDCLVAQGPEALAQQLDAVARSIADRKRLANAVRATYDRHFTFEAQIPKYERALAAALRVGARPRAGWLS
ncbi:MAG: hypothetical protein IT376_21935 [Polyangiaceae bacterium]|nr:hypothetical protein [Polyangiaceae bacterium]